MYFPFIYEMSDIKRTLDDGVDEILNSEVI